MARCHLRHSFRGGCHRELSFAVGRQPSGGEQPAAPQIGGSILPRIPDHLSRISTRLIADTGCVKSCLLRKTPSKADRRLYLSSIVINHNIRQFKVYFPKESNPCPVSIDIHRRHSPGKVSKPFSGSQSQRAGRDRLSAVCPPARRSSSTEDEISLSLHPALPRDRARLLQGDRAAGAWRRAALMLRDRRERGQETHSDLQAQRPDLFWQDSTCIAARHRPVRAHPAVKDAQDPQEHPHFRSGYNGSPRGPESLLHLPDL